MAKIQINLKQTVVGGKKIKNLLLPEVLIESRQGWALGTASLLVVSEPESSCLCTLDTGRALINYSVQKPLGVSDTPSRS